MRFKNFKQTEFGGIATWEDRYGDHDADVSEDNTVGLYHPECTEPWKNLPDFMQDEDKRNAVKTVFELYWNKYCAQLKKTKTKRRNKISTNTWYNDMTIAQREEFIRRFSYKAIGIIDDYIRSNPSCFLVQRGYYNNLKTRVMLGNYNLDDIDAKFLPYIPRKDPHDSKLIGGPRSLVKLIGLIYKSPKVKRSYNTVTY